MSEAQGRGENGSRQPAGKTPLLRWMVAAALLLLSLPVLVACAGRDDFATQDDFTVTFATQPDPPLIGTGVVTVTVTDKSGQGVGAARISLEASMDHEGMVPVYADIDSSLDGAYATRLKWTMAGDWYVNVKVRLADGEQLRRRFTVKVK